MIVQKMKNKIDIKEDLILDGEEALDIGYNTLEFFKVFTSLLLKLFKNTERLTSLFVNICKYNIMLHQGHLS
jgi:hypothetical protein